MRNRPTSSLQEETQQNSRGWSLNLDRNPIARLAVLFVVLVAPFLFVTAKLAQLQGLEQDDFTSGLESKVTESFEVLPTNDGRILMGATVLARDVISYRLKLHYRWLEEPADAGWLRRKAIARLSKSDRKLRDRLVAAEEQIQEERRRMQQRLAAAIGISEEELRPRMRAIQLRVEDIVKRVEATRERRVIETQREREQAREEVLAKLGWTERLLSDFRDELTTPPQRSTRERVIVEEELNYHVIAEEVPFARVSEIVTQPTLFPGVEYEISTRREYPQGALASHLIGVRKPVDTPATAVASDAAEPPNSERQPEDRVGLMGIERSYDRWLTGRRGELRIIRNGEGEIIRREVVREVQPGADVEVALIEPLQRRAEALLDHATGTRPLRWDEDVLYVKNSALPDRDHALDDIGEPPAQIAKGGCIVAMNVATGELLAAACAPRFDLRVLVDFREELWSALKADPRDPMFPRTTRMALPPGSVFKTMTAIAALEEHVVDPFETTQCNGFFDPNKPTKHRCVIYRKLGYGHGAINLEDALAKSCNIYFFNRAKELGPKRLVNWSHRLGFGELSGIDVPGESPGNVPLAAADEYLRLTDFETNEPDSSTTGSAGVRRASAASGRPIRWSQADTIEYGIGQSKLEVTPLQIVRLMAAVANGGDLVAPRVVHEVAVVRDGRRTPVELPEIQPTRSGVSQRTLHFVRQGLDAVVVRGTASRHAKLKEVTIAGKTGTAETGNHRPDHAWFAGYVPADRPQIAFVVVLEHGGSGATAAAPLAKAMITEMLSLGLLAPAEAKSASKP